MKNYIGHVQFFAVEVEVKAKNKADARKKIKAKMAKKKASLLMDKRNCFIDEI
jgi:hypothetical protein